MDKKRSPEASRDSPLSCVAVSIRELLRRGSCHSRDAIRTRCSVRFLDVAVTAWHGTRND